MSAVTLHHEIDGPPDAPGLVLSPSLGTTLAMWEPQTARLAERFRVIRYDHRGHGRSPAPPGPYTIADLGADVLALLDGAGLDRVSFCGVSLGGMVGMWLAAEAPERIDALVGCCTSADLGPASAWRERARVVRAQGTGAVAQTIVERWFTPAFRTRHPELVRRYEEMITATPSEGYAACCEAIATMDLVARIGRVGAPTLLIAGERDPATPPDHAARAAASIPGARVEVVPDAAHLANVERPDAVTTLILDHLTGGPA